MRKPTPLIYIGLLFTLFFSYNINAQTDSTEIANYQFSHLYGKNSGLPDNWVWKVYQDSRGFTWIATHDGLLRWDGLTFHLYIPNDKDTTAILGATIVDILEDKEGYVWFASHTKGISRFDHRTETFQNFRHKSHLKGIICMKQDPEGIFWLGSFGNGMFRYDPKRDSLTAHPIQTTYAEGETAFRFNSVLDVVEDIEDNNILWVAGNNGLFKFDKQAATFQRFPSTAPKTSLMAINAVWQDADKPDQLWLAGFGGGMILFNIPTATWNYHVHELENFIHYDGYRNVVMGMEQKSDDEFWVNTMHYGGGVFNTKTGKFTFFEHKYDDPTSISWGEGWSIDKDKSGRIWFNFKNRGVSYINPDCQAFYSLPLNMGDCSQQSANNITDFAFSSEGNKIYAVANSCDGLFEINPSLKTHQVIPTLGFEKQYQIFSTVFVTKKGAVWVGGRANKGGKGDHFQRPTLFYLDKKIGKLRPFEHSLAKSLKLQENNVIDFYEDYKENLWVATDNGKLYEIDFATDKINVYSLDKWKDNQPIVDIAQMIKADNGLWIGTSHGIFNFDFSSQTFNQLKGSSPFRVSSLAKDSTGQIWFGTREEGLKMIHPAQPDSIIHPEIGDLPRTPIDKVLIDKNNHPWLSAQKGIYYLDKTLNYFQNYNENDGLIFNRFYQHGFCQLPNGNMLLGRNGGYYQLQPECLTKPEKIDTVFISEFSVPNKPLSQPPNLLRKVELEHDENFINIEFSTQSYCQADKIRFTYQLEGMNQGWETTKPGRPYTKYTDVRPGNYRFKVYQTGFPNTMRSIDITIFQPWWNTWLAWPIYIAGFVYAFRRYQRNQLDKKILQKESQQLKEWNEQQTQLYANITHEFRTPLTVVMGLAGQIEKETLDTEVALKAVSIQKNSNRFLSLINQILDLEKAKKGETKLNIVQKEINPVLAFIPKNLHPLATNKRIELVSQIEFDTLIMDFDEDKLITILSNLLANAIKFTPDGGAIFYRAKKLEGQLYIEIEDTGIGIDPKFQNRIFERYFNLDIHTGKSGTGIGLSLSRTLIELMGGAIKVKSEKGKGSTFIVSLPITNKASKPEINTTISPKNHFINPDIILPIPSSEDKGKPIVLVIEDNLEIASLLATILKEDYQIYFAKDGQEGIEKAMEVVPDLIISDVMMPRKDGYEVCATLKEQEITSHIPIILLTSKAKQQDKIAGLKKGADTYLTKPFDQQELLVWINNLLNSRLSLKNRYGNTDSIDTPLPNIVSIEGIDLDIEDRFVKKLLHLFEANLANSNYGSGMIYQDLGVSKTQAYRKIIALTQLSPGNFLKLYRLSKAKILLDTTDMNITEVAYATGFQDASYFTRAFKSTFNMTPSTFKEKTIST